VAVNSDVFGVNPDQPAAWRCQRLPPAGRLDYAPGFVGAARADALLQSLGENLDWAQRPIMIFGRSVLQPRLTAFHGDDGVGYRYSGKTLAAQPWTVELEGLRQLLFDQLAVKFNCVLCNLYRDGKDSMGWHADNEPELGAAPVIASISLGAERRFQLKSRSDSTLRRELLLEHGSLLVMAGDLQQHWLHQLPKTARVDQPRINLTFRAIV
jgi:alkylated DNA repair dioxygenase AlkB